MKTEKSLLELRTIQNTVLNLVGYTISSETGSRTIEGAIPKGNMDSKAYKKLEKFYKKSIEKPLEKFKEIEELLMSST